MCIMEFLELNAGHRETTRVANESITSITTMPASMKAAATYLKKPGTVEISADRKTLSWTPAASTTATLTILTESIDSTPDSRDAQYLRCIG